MFVREYKGRDGRQYKTDLTLYILMALEVVELLEPGGRGEKKIGGQWGRRLPGYEFQRQDHVLLQARGRFQGEKELDFTVVT